MALTKEQLERMADFHRQARELHTKMVEAGLAEGSYEEAIAKKTAEVLQRMLGD
jgi:hypothetical protein